MASVDSGVETSNDSNDSSATEPQAVGSPASKSKEIIVYQVPSSMASNSYHSRPIDVTKLTGEEVPTLHFRCPILPPFTALPPLPPLVPFEDDVLFSSDRRSLRDRRLARASKVRHRNYSVTELRRLMLKKSYSTLADERKLRVAVMTNNIELVQNLLWCNVTPNSSDSHKRTPLHLAACRGYADIVRLLLDNGADPNRRDLLGNTPLHLAACTNNVVVVTLLLKAGTDVKSVDDFGRSPLQIAQSKLKLLQTFATDDSSTQINNQVFQIIEMLREFLNRRGQDLEAELINGFSTRLTMSKTRDQVGNQVRGLLASLSHLSLDGKKLTAVNDNGSSSNNNTLKSNIVDGKEGSSSVISEAPKASGTNYLIGERPTFSLRSALWAPSIPNFCGCSLTGCSSCSIQKGLVSPPVSTSSAASSGSFESLME